jgi:hypothetical protein
MPSLARLLATTAAALVCSVTALAATTHPVNLTPPWTVGQRYSAETTFTQTHRMTVRSGDRVLKEHSQRTSARLRAEAEALEVFPNGGLKKTRFTIGSLLVTEGEAAEREFLPAGTVVVVERVSDSEETILIGDQPATPEQKTVLASLISTDEATRNDQILFGPSKPVAVGDTWPIDANTFAKAMESSLGKVGAARGTMTLDAFTGEGSAGVATISGNLTIVLQPVPLPPGFTFKSGKATFALHGRIPVSRPGTERHETLKGTVDISGEARSGEGAAPIVFQARSEMDQRGTLRFR